MTRAEALRRLGWAPEDGTEGDRYAASTGELVRWALEKTEKTPDVAFLVW